MFVAEAIPPTGPVFIPALAGLFALAALIVLIGLVKAVDAVSRAFFGSLGSSFGWIPGVGGLVKKSVHRIEQKISHILGSAEQKLDAAVAMTWHNMARLVAYMGTEIAGIAQATWQLAQQAEAFVRRREVTHEIKTAVKPVRARAIGAQRVGKLARDEARAVHHSVAQGVYPRLKVGEHERAHVLNPGVASARAQAKTAEDAAIATYRYIVRHRRSVIAGVFTGAVAWALTRLGGGWIRCANWRRLGRAVCRMPRSFIDGLLALLALEIALHDLRRTTQLAEDALEFVTGLVWDAAAIGDRPRGQFTIE